MQVVEEVSARHVLKGDEKWGFFGANGKHIDDVGVIQDRSEPHLQQKLFLRLSVDAGLQLLYGHRHLKHTGSSQSNNTTQSAEKSWVERVKGTRPTKNTQAKELLPMRRGNF